MEVINQVIRTDEDLQAFVDRGIEGPVAMVHLLRFRDRAEYSDGRETDLTGAQAYALYRERLVEQVTAVGGRLVFRGAVRHLVLGQVEELWDEVMILEFPSPQAFVDIISAPQTAEWGTHRRAGLDGQLLIAATAHD